MRIRQWETWINTCVMAIWPLITWLITSYMTSGRTAIRTEATRELIFFAVSTFGAGALALIETAHRSSSRLWLSVGVFCALGASVAYGTFLTGEALHAAALMRRAYDVSKVSAIAALVYSAIVHRVTKQGGSHGRSLH